MFHMNYRDADGVEGEFTWRVGEEAPSETLEGVKIVEILSVMASGKELDHIKDFFKNLPYAETISIWRGEFARFIFDNLA